MSARTIPTTTKTLTFRFYNNSDALFDPTTVTAEVIEPSGRKTVYTSANAYPPASLTNSSTGVYVLKVDFIESGRHRIIWTGQTAGSSGGKIAGEEYVSI